MSESEDVTALQSLFTVAADPSGRPVNVTRYDGQRLHPPYPTCPWCHVDITGTTPERPHRCGFLR